MNFSFARCWNLLKLQLAVNRKLYLLGILALAGIMLSVLSFIAYMDGLGYDAQQMICYIGLIICNTIFTSTIFKHFSRKESRMSSIMLPVSVPERMAVAILLSIIIFPVIYFLITFPCIRLVNRLDYLWFRHSNGVLKFGGEDDRIALMINFFVQSAVLLGAAWFRKLVFVKSVILLFVVAFGFVLLNNMIARPLIDHTVRPAWGEKQRTFQYAESVPFYKISLRGFYFQENGMQYIEGPYYHVKLPQSKAIPVFVLIWLTPFFLWYLAGVRIKEQEV